MYMRLGFAVAIHVDPDVLLVDEVLAVGDEGFTHKCLDKFAEFKRARQDDPARHALARPRRAVLRRSALARCAADRRVSEIRARDRGRLRHRRRRSRRKSQLAAADAKAQESAVDGRRPTNRRRRDPPDHPIETAEAAGGHVPRNQKGRWGSREVEITDVLLTSDDGEPRPRVSYQAAGWTSGFACVPPIAIDDFVIGIRHLQRRRSLLLRHQYEPRGSQRRADLRRRRGDVHHRQPGSGRGNLQAGCRRPQGWTAIRTTITGSCHVPCEVTDAGRRHLSAPASVARSRTESRSRRVGDPGVRIRLERASRASLTAGQAVAFVQRRLRVGGKIRCLHERRVRPPASGTRPLPADARALGDALIVGLNGDASVRRNKGAERPINPERGARARYSRASRASTRVVIFDDDTPAEIIRTAAA